MRLHLRPYVSRFLEPHGAGSSIRQKRDGEARVAPDEDRARDRARAEALAHVVERDVQRPAVRGVDVERELTGRRPPGGWPARCRPACTPWRSIIGRAATSSARAVARIGSVASVASVSVCDRVARVKSSKRRRRTTVRQQRRPVRSRRVTRSTSADQPRVERLRRARRAAAERALRPDRAAPAAGHHPPRVAVVRQGVELAPGRPSRELDERALAQRRDLADRDDPARAQLRRGDRTHAPQPLHRQRMQEGQLAVGRDDEQAVGLRHPARHLGQELGPRDADRDRQPDALAHLAPQPQRDVGRRRRRSGASRARR